MSYRWLLPLCSLLLLEVVTPARADSTVPPQQEPSNKLAAVSFPTPITLQQADEKFEQLERAAAEQANVERRKAGLKPLTYSIDLSDVARAHSLEMRERKFFGHDSPTVGLRTALDRYRAAYHEAPPVVAENLYAAWGGTARQLGEDDIRHAHKSLMHSPTHKANILFPNLTHIGVGIVTNSSGDIWLTEMFICAKSPQVAPPTLAHGDKAAANASG